MKNSTTQRQIVIVEGLSADGQAFVHCDGIFVQVPGFLPGDKIDLEYTESGKLIEVAMLDPSPERVKPDCFFHGPCGGCDLLELSEKGRKKEKQAMIARVLKRIPGGSEAAVHSFAASRELIRYLPRVRLHQSRDYNERESGFLAAENFVSQVPGGVVPVTACALVTQPLARRLIAARKILNQIPIFLDSLTLMSSSSHRSDRVAGHAVLMKNRSIAQHDKDLVKIMRAINLKGLSVSDSNGKIKDVQGSMSLTGLVASDVTGGPYEAEPSFFVQGNIYQNPVLIRKVVELCKPAPGMRIVEGFAGAGNFTLALAAEGAQLQAVESHPGAIRSGKRNLHRSGFPERIRLIEGDAAKELTNFEPEPDVLLLDPPRSGMPAIGRVAAKLRPQKIVVVFCDLNACERDSIALSKNGYRLTEAAGLDLYPRTHHVELVCVFQKE